jgi:hypothetical protein
MNTLYRIKGDIAAVVTAEFLRGGPLPDVKAHVEPVPEQWDEQVIRGLLDHGLSLDFSRDKELDAWLAPRLHYLLRISRRTASDRWVWTWLAMTVGRGYVIRRWGEDGRVTLMRYDGELLRNALSRLWWGAELVRNGPSYEYAPVAFRNVRTAQFALELKYSWYRPAAIAFARVAEGFDGGKVLTDEEKKSLSKSVNAYLSLTALEARGLDEDETQDPEWRRHRPALAEGLVDDVAKLQGPRDGFVSGQAVTELERWFRKIADQILVGATA